MTINHQSKEICRQSPGTDLERQTVAKIYGRWAPFYDLVFGSFFDRGRYAAIAVTKRIGGRILDVGVGTGIALPRYAPATRVVGVDLSQAMLRRAKARVATQRLLNVEGLAVMDAERLAFPDASFDAVVAQYVINTVPNPEAVLDELLRVLSPGGEIVLVNRIGAETGARRTVERWLMPLVRRLGWRSEFPWTRFARWAEQTHGVHLIDCRRMPPFGHFALIRFGKAPGPSDWSVLGTPRPESRATELPAVQRQPVGQEAQGGSLAPE
jgi:phosphatidylethanolamine/phosphatidyl-N-methylethanolamine N-methyltransferase